MITFKETVQVTNFSNTSKEHGFRASCSKDRRLLRAHCAYRGIKRKILRA